MRVIGAGRRIDEAARELVSIVGHGFGAELVELWWIDEETAVLCNLALWCAPGLDVGDFAERSRSTTFARGEGLPGRAWRAQADAWVADLAADASAAHAALARRSGLAAALALPIAADGLVRGVVVAAFRESEPLDEDSTALMKGIFVSLAERELRRQAEETHVRRDELLRYVARATQDAIYDWHIPENFVWRNEAYEEIYMPDDPTLSGNDWWAEHLHPDDASRVVDGLEAALHYGADIWMSEYRLKKGDGSYATVIDRGHVIRDEEGRAIRMIGAMTDITERARASAALAKSERALRASEAKYRTLYTETPAMMHSIDRDGRLLSVSHEWLRKLGYDESEVLGRHSTDFLTPESADYAARVILPDFFETGVCTDVGYQMVKRNGDVMDVLLSATAEHDADGVGRSLAVMVDVTEKKRAEVALHTSLREKEVLLKELHHRVKNNLQIISSILGLQSQRVADAEARDLFRECQGRVRAMALVHDNLYETRNFAVVDVPELLRSLSSNVLRLFGADSRRIKLDLSVEPVVLEVEKAIPCALITSELLTNALKHAFPDERAGRIELALRQVRDTDVSLSVADDGVGIPAGVDPSASDSLGLDIVRTLTRQLRGELSVSRDGGTKVTITFPRVERIEQSAG